MVNMHNIALGCVFFFFAHGAANHNYFFQQDLQPIMLNLFGLMFFGLIYLNEYDVSVIICSALAKFPFLFLIFIHRIQSVKWSILKLNQKTFNVIDQRRINCFLCWWMFRSWRITQTLSLDSCTIEGILGVHFINPLKDLFIFLLITFQILSFF